MNKAEEIIWAVETAARLECGPNLEHLVIFLSDGRDSTVVPLLNPRRTCVQEVAASMSKGQYLIGAAIYQDEFYKLVELGKGEETPELLRDAWEIYDASLHLRRLN